MSPWHPLLNHEWTSSEADPQPAGLTTLISLRKMGRHWEADLTGMSALGMHSVRPVVL
jgi:hypothetical protein